MQYAIDVSEKFLVVCSSKKKLEEISNYLKNRISLKIVDDKVLYFDITDLDYEGTKYNDIIKNIVDIDNNAKILSEKYYYAESFKNIYYCEYLYTNGYVSNIEYEDITQRVDYNNFIEEETIESFIVKHYSSMLDYLEITENSNKYGEIICKCPMCGNEAKVFEDNDKLEFGYMNDVADIFCGYCDNFLNSNLIELHKVLKNISYEESLEQLFYMTISKYINEEKFDKDLALKKFRNMIKDIDYQLYSFDEYYKEYLERDNKKKEQIEYEEKNAKNSYIKEKYDNLYNKYKNTICKLDDEFNPFILDDDLPF